jgi:hypothetical protein
MKILKPECTDKYLKVTNVLDEQFATCCLQICKGKGFFQRSHKFMQPYGKSDFSGNTISKLGTIAVKFDTVLIVFSCRWLASIRMWVIILGLFHFIFTDSSQFSSGFCCLFSSVFFIFICSNLVPALPVCNTSFSEFYFAAVWACELLSKLGLQFTGIQRHVY